MNKRMKKIFVIFLILLVYQAQAQDFSHFSGGYEAYLQYYQDDAPTNFEAPSDRIRSMNYFNVGYQYKQFSLGLQYEAYLPQAFLGYNPALDDNGIATYFAAYHKDNLDITAGYFYDQFGSGLVFRAWEDRQLGINNAVRGIRVKYNFDDLFTFTALTGNQRLAFDLSKSTLYGANADININKIFKLKKWQLKGGFSYLGRFEQTASANPDLKPLVSSYSSRLDVTVGSFNSNFEYVYKTPDSRAANQVLLDQVLFDGNAWLWNLGYSQKGLGVNATFRRLENIQMYSERLLEGNSYNTGVLNFVPGLTKQHDFSLANIYVYQAQPGISFGEEKFGEIGGQIDVFYTFKRKTALGGKYGTKLAFNISRWHGLNATFDHARQIYRADFFKPGELYFQDINLEIRKKLTKNFKTVFTYIDVKYNKPKLEGEGEFVHANIAVADLELKLNKKRSARLELQHLATKDDLKNWAAALLEYNFNHHFNMYAGDMYNYGNEFNKTHYFNVGATYTKSSARLSLSYGRQRGGLLCVGGVCRNVPASKGVTASISMSF
jgi:hypothetical protein